MNWYWEQFSGCAVCLRRTVNTPKPEPYARAQMGERIFGAKTESLKLAFIALGPGPLTLNRR